MLAVRSNQRSERIMGCGNLAIFWTTSSFASLSRTLVSIRMRFGKVVLDVAAILLLGPEAYRAARAQGGGAWPGPTIDAIKKRGMLVCGVDTGVPGFASQDSTGRWRGLDISYCRAIAAALLNDAEKVRYVPTTAAARKTAKESPTTTCCWPIT
jgi:ABC-type amino acid transport substrate-binding protein